MRRAEGGGAVERSARGRWGMGGEAWRCALERGARCGEGARSAILGGEVWGDPARCGEAWRGVARCGEVWRGVGRSGEVWRGVARWHLVQQLLDLRVLLAVRVKDEARQREALAHLRSREIGGRR